MTEILFFFFLAPKRNPFSVAVRDSKPKRGSCIVIAPGLCGYRFLSLLSNHRVLPAHHTVPCVYSECITLVLSKCICPFKQILKLVGISRNTFPFNLKELCTKRNFMFFHMTKHR